jgi:hypothetical protein
MKSLRSSLIIFMAAAFMFSCGNEPKEQGKAVITDISEFLGQWTIDIEGGAVGWLEVRQEDKYIDADLLWESGSVEPVAGIFLLGNRYLVATRVREVVRKKDDEGNAIRKHIITTWFEAEKEGEKIKGYLLSPKNDGTGVDSTAFTGRKLPPVPAAPDLSKIKYGEPVTLFNGKDLTGWKLVDDKLKNGFSVTDGLLVNNPVQVEGQPHVSYGNLRTEQEFTDFNLKLEVNVPAGSNSGIYLRGMYEVQVFDSYKKPLDPHNMGGLYSRIKPSVNAEKPAGEWQTLDITLCERHLTVILNNITIIDNQPVYGPTGGAIKSDVFTAGPLFLQGDHGIVSYRNIILTPIVK